jgi:hypothetical protein
LVRKSVMDRSGIEPNATKIEFSERKRKQRSADKHFVKYDKRDSGDGPILTWASKRADQHQRPASGLPRPRLTDLDMRRPFDVL